MHIRRATEADLEPLRRLWDSSVRETTFTPYPGNPFDESLITEHTGLVAKEGDQVLGTVYVNTSSADFGFVFGLYVVPEARRKGIARDLMRAVARLLAAQGRSYIVLSVDTPNEQARSLYDRLGFEDAARLLRVEVAQLLADTV
jgi:ribosomal protein S18 acetylase RimI-like enzyme